MQKPFISGTCYYDTTKDPLIGFYIASAVWHSDLREHEQVLQESMELGL